LAPDGGGHARRDGRVFRFIRVDLDAQLQAQGFYERLGYVSHGDDTFWDAGIEHRHLAQLIEGTAEPLR
ncbi:MAG: hypothetical protein E6253_09175, partial [Actinomyces sp.]|nr:hypothetical protein [Actinomyces sp.]